VLGKRLKKAQKLAKAKLKNKLFWYDGMDEEGMHQSGLTLSNEDRVRNAEKLGLLGMIRKTTNFCQNICCSNRRQWEGKTLAEKRNDDSFKEQMDNIRA
jgi:hypothetical protein